MTKITLSPLRGACSRTKNRLREHPGAFTLTRTENPMCFEGRKAHLVEHPDGWSGWLPADEVELAPCSVPVEA